MLKFAKTFFRFAISGILVAVLLYIAHRQHVWATLRTVPPASILTGIVLLAVGWLINSLRWALLLRAAGVRENLFYLAGMYFIGMFFSTFLPTGAGGDAVRMWDVARRNHAPAAAIVATLQERLLGMGVSMLVGLYGAYVYYDRLPDWARLPFIGISILATIACGLFLYPRIPLAVGTRCWRIFAGHSSTKNARPPGRFRKSITGIFRQAAELPPITAQALPLILLVTLIGDLFSIAAWWALARGVGMDLPILAFFLAIPAVWVVSMAPSVGGVGVREGGFAYIMMHLFQQPMGKSLSVAALYLIVQTILACLGGVILLVRIWTGNWQGRQRKKIDMELEAA